MVRSAKTQGSGSANETPPVEKQKIVTLIHLNGDFPLPLKLSKIFFSKFPGSKLGDRRKQSGAHSNDIFAGFELVTISSVTLERTSLFIGLL